MCVTSKILWKKLSSHQWLPLSLSKFQAKLDNSEIAPKRTLRQSKPSLPSTACKQHSRTWVQKNKKLKEPALRS